MAIITRGTKSANGGTAFVDDTDALASEVNTDFDTIYAEFNGGITTDNISASAAITSTQLAPVADTNVDDSSASDALQATVTSPGDTGSPTPPTDLRGEIRTLRHRIKALNGYGTDSYYVTDGNSNAGISWTEPAIRGRNLLANPGFEVHSAGTPNAPDGWTLVGTPAIVEIETPAYPSSGLEKRSLHITSDAANEGLIQTIKGLKSSTKYLVGVNYAITGGAVALTTTGALGASTNYQDIILADSAVPTEGSLQGVIKTDATPTDITFSITETTGSSGDLNIISAWCYELNDNQPSELPAIPSQRVVHNVRDVIPPVTTPFALAWVWETVSELTLSQYIPAPGYRLIYSVTLTYLGESLVGSAPASDYESEFGFRLGLDSGSGVSVVEGPYVVYQIITNRAQWAFNFGGVMQMDYVIDNAEPGLTYTFTTDGGAYVRATDDSRLVLNPVADTEQSVSTAKLRVERM